MVSRPEYRDEMPAVEEEAAVPYSDDQLKKLFAEMAATGGVETVKGKEYDGAGLGKKFVIDSFWERLAEAKRLRTRPGRTLT